MMSNSILYYLPRAIGNVADSLGWTIALISGGICLSVGMGLGAGIEYLYLTHSNSNDVNTNLLTPNESINYNNLEKEIINVDPNIDLNAFNL